MRRFAIVVIPVYEDPEDQKESPFKLNNAEPFSWSWLSTINRVNSQVQKVFFLPAIMSNCFQLNRPLDTNLDVCDHPGPLAHWLKHPGISCCSCSLLNPRSRAAAIYSCSYA